jgi:hypothetical protein
MHASLNGMVCETAFVREVFGGAAVSPAVLNPTHHRT